YYFVARRVRVSSHRPLRDCTLLCIVSSVHSSPITAISSLSLHDALPIFGVSNLQSFIASMTQKLTLSDISDEPLFRSGSAGMPRSEERFSRNAETDLVCRLLLEKKKK